MSHDFDDGLVHDHSWARSHAQTHLAAASRPGRAERPRLVADAARVTTPSSVFHDDLHHTP